MSENQTKLEMLQAQMKAFWKSFDGDEKVESKVVEIDSGQPYVEPPEEELQAEEFQVNNAMIEDLKLMLQRAESGEINSMSYVVSGPAGTEREIVLLGASQELEQDEIHRHLVSVTLLQSDLTEYALVFDAPDGLPVILIDGEEDE